MRRRWRAGPHRSAVAVSGEAPQRAGAGGSDGDPGTSGPGASADRAGEYGSWTGEVLRGTAARLQCAQHECEKAEGLSPELQAALEPLLLALESLSTQIREYNERIETLGAGKLSAGGPAEADQGRGHADRADVLADFGRSASFSPEPRRGLLPGTAARTKKLGTERAADAHQQGRRSLSAHPTGARGAAHSGSV